MKKQCLIVIGIIAFANFTNAQTIDTKQLSTFSPSIVAKVYNIASNIKINSQKQLALAKLYTAQDSIITLKILSGADSKEINEVANDFENKLSFILSPTELKSYYLNLVNAFNSQNSEIAKQYISEAKATAYIVNKTQILNGFKPLSKTLNERLINDFIKLASNATSRDYPDYLNQVMRDCSLDTIYFSQYYKDEIKTTAKNEMNKRLRLGKISAKDTALVYDREKQIKLISLSKDEGSEKDKMLAKVADIYNPKIDSVQILSGIETVKSYLDFALKHDSLLHLSAVQKRGLQNEIVQLKKRRADNKIKKKAGSETDGEFLFLGNLLDKNQLRSFEMLRYEAPANNYAHKTWSDIKRNKLNVKDSVSAIEEIKNYKLATLVKKSLSSRYATSMVDSNTIIPGKPIILRRLDVINKTTATTEVEKSKW
jgi:hypothetical protein